MFMLFKGATITAILILNFEDQAPFFSVRLSDFKSPTFKSTMMPFKCLHLQKCVEWPTRATTSWGGPLPNSNFSKPIFRLSCDSCPFCLSARLRKCINWALDQKISVQLSLCILRLKMRFLNTLEVFVLLWTVPLAHSFSFTSSGPHDLSARSPSGSKTVIIQMFEWSWDSIAAECKSFIGPAGYGSVQGSMSSNYHSRW